jgi:hypothetical protein
MAAQNRPDTRVLEPAEEDHDHDDENSSNTNTAAGRAPHQVDLARCGSPGAALAERVRRLPLADVVGITAMIRMISPKPSVTIAR